MKRFFSGKLYLQSLRRMRTLGIAMLICITVLNIFLPIMGIMRNSSRQDFYDYDSSYEYIDGTDIITTSPRITEIEDIEFAPFLWAVIAFAPLLVYFSFSFLHERKQADFYHSLPQKRVCVYLSMMAAALTWLVGTVLLSTLINTLLWSFAKYYSFTFLTVLGNLVFYSVLALFAASFMALAIMITGTTTSTFLAFFYLALFPRFAVFLFKSALEEEATILMHTRDILPLLSFDRWIVTAWWDGFAQDGFFSDPAVLIYSVVLAVAVLALSGFCYHIRRSESAGRSAPNAILQHVYRILFTCAIAIIIPFAIILDGFDDYVFLLLLLVFVVYALYELMTVKKIRSMLRSFKLIWIPFAVCFAFAGSVLAAKAYVYSIRPDADEIESVVFLDIYSDSYGDMLVYSREHTDPEVITLCANALYGTLDGISYGPYQSTIDISYRLKNGKVLDRHLSVAEDFWTQVCTTASLRENYFALPSQDEIISINVYPFPVANDSGFLNSRYEEMLRRVWNTFSSEFYALSDEEKLTLLDFSERYDYRWNNFHIRVATNIKNTRLGKDWLIDFHYVLTPELMPRTVELLTSLYGTDEEILNYLIGLKDEKFSDTAYFWTKNGDGYRYHSDSSARFFDSVTLDMHLFLGEPNTMVEIKGISLWLNLTETELEGIYDYVIDYEYKPKFPEPIPSEDAYVDTSSPEATETIVIWD